MFISSALQRLVRFRPEPGARECRCAVWGLGKLRAMQACPLPYWPRFPRLFWNSGGNFPKLLPSFPLTSNTSEGPSVCVHLLDWVLIHRVSSS